MSCNKVIFIASKPISKQNQGILSSTGAVRVFNKDCVVNDVSAYIANSCGSVNNYVWFDISQPEIHKYIELNFKVLEAEPYIFIVKHQHEDIDEDWISQMKKVRPNLVVLSKIPDVRSSFTDFLEALNSKIEMKKPLMMCFRIVQKLLKVLIL